jgi:hypothetical protein
VSTTDEPSESQQAKKESTPETAVESFGADAVSGFGAAAPASTGGFGAAVEPSGFGGFGAATAAATAPAPASGFGAAAPASTGGFDAAVKPSGFGGFGAATAAAAAPASGFGAAAPASTGGFGAAVKPSGFGGFGAAAAPASGFGAAAPASTSGFGGFGAAVKPSGFGGFGAAAAPASGFGAAAPASTGGFGGFGGAAAASAPLGAPASTPSPFGTSSAPAFGGFGAAAPATGAPAPAAASQFGTPGSAVFGGFGAPTTSFGALAAAAPKTPSFLTLKTDTKGPSAFALFCKGEVKSDQPATPTKIPPLIICPRMVLLDSNLLMKRTTAIADASDSWNGEMKEATTMTPEAAAYEESDTESDVASDDEDEVAIWCNVELSYDIELEKNTLLKEAHWLNIPSVSRPTSILEPQSAMEEENGGDVDMDMLPPPPAPLSEVHRQTSVSFVKTRNLTPFSDIKHILTFKDKAGNTAAHHAAFMGLTKTYNTLLSLGASRYALNEANICPAAVLCGVATLYPLPPSSPPTSSCRVGGHLLPLNTFDRGDAMLFRNLTRRSLLPDELVRKAFRTSADATCSSALEELQNALLEMRTVSEHSCSSIFTFDIFLMICSGGSSAVSFRVHQHRLLSTCPCVLDYCASRCGLWRACCLQRIGCLYGHYSKRRGQ